MNNRMFSYLIIFTYIYKFTHLINFDFEKGLKVYLSLFL